MGEYSFIVEFDEMSENKISKLWEYLSEKNIKFHVLKEEDLKNENQELKKQLENTDYTSVYLKGCTDTKGKYLSQQKEFIEYLEDKLNMCDGFLDTIKSDLEEISYAGRIAGKNYIATQIMKNETSKKNYEEVLSKYKEIIGGDNK